jgi:hypothetical protein
MRRYQSRMSAACCYFVALVQQENSNEVALNSAAYSVISRIIREVVGATQGLPT